MKKIIVISFMLIFFSCASQKNETNGIVAKSWDNPNVLESYGNRDADKVLIYLQGGPAIEVDHNLSGLSKSGLVDLEKIFMVSARQVQNSKPEIFRDQEISFEEAKKYDLETLENLYQLVTLFKKENKKVYLLGVSYGAFILEGFIEKYGNIADKNLIVVGRLDIEEKVWKAFSEGKPLGYKNGTEIVEGSFARSGIFGEGKYIKANLGKLFVGLAYKRYTKSLSQVDLSNTTYVFATLDEQAGKLTEDEISFLKSKNVKTVEINADHQGAGEKFLKENLVNWLNDKI